MRKALLITALGIGGGQLVLLAFTPLLARAYSPDEFGVYAAVVALATVIASVSSLRYETAVTVVPEKSLPAVSRLAVSLPFVVCPVFLGIVSASTFFFPGLVQALPRGMEWLVGSIALLQGCVSVAYALCTRNGFFGLASALRVAQPASFVVGALLLIEGLSFALFFSWAVSLVIAMFMLKRIAVFAPWSGTVEVAKANWRYPVLYAPVSLLDNLTLALPVLAIVSIFGGGEAGNYSQVQRLLGAPMLLIGMAVGQVFVKYAGDHLRCAKPLGRMFIKVFGALCLGGGALLLLIAVGGEWIVRSMLGSGWKADTGYLLLVVLPLVFRTIVSPLTSVFLLCEKIKLVAVWQLSYFTAMAAIVAFAWKGLSFDGYLWALMFGEFLMYLAYFTLALSIVRRFDASLNNAGDGEGGV